MVRHFRIDSPKNKPKGKVKKEEPPKASASCSSDAVPNPKPYAKAKAFLDEVASQREQETKKLKRENKAEQLDAVEVVYESDWSHLAHGLLKQLTGQNGNESPSPESVTPEQKEANLRTAKLSEALGRRLEEERRGGAARGKATRGRSPHVSPLENLHESPSKPSSVDRRVILGAATKTPNGDFDESPSQPSSVERRVVPGAAKTPNGELLDLQPQALKDPFYKFLRSDTETGTFPTSSLHLSPDTSSAVKDHDWAMVSETSTTDSPEKPYHKEERKRTQNAEQSRPPVIKDPADLSVMSESSTIGSPEGVFDHTFGMTTPLFGNTPAALFGNTTSAFRPLSPQRRASLASYASAQSTFSNDESSSPMMTTTPLFGNTPAALFGNTTSAFRPLSPQRRASLASYASAQSTFSNDESSSPMMTTTPPTKAPASKTISSYPNTNSSAFATPASYATQSPFRGFLCDPSTLSPEQKTPSPTTPSPTPTPTPTPFRSSQCDTSLVPPIQQHAETDDWKGWLPVADRGGSLFFYHVPSETSAWEQPPELSSVLGEWEMIEGSEHQSGPYWHNALLKASVWRDPAQVTSIFQAAMDNNVVFLQLYAHVNGDFDAVDGKGRRALHYACASGSVQACQMLIHFKATLDAPDYNKSSPLLFAARYGYSSLCRLLIDSRASVNVRNSLGDSCLHEAAQLGQVDCVVLLLLVKADCEAKNSRNLLPEEVAKANKHVECAQILHESLLKQQRLADFGGAEGEESGVSDSIDYEEVESEDSEDEKPNVLQTPNRTTKNLVQRMQPILKGVQGAVNTLFPIKADLGQESRFYFDDQLNEWALR